MALAATALLLPSCKENDGFTMADTDKDDRISPAEFERYMLEAVYAEADADSNSQITYEEWQAANPDADKAKFYAPDKNGDKVVTPEEAKANESTEPDGKKTWIFKADQVRDFAWASSRKFIWDALQHQMDDFPVMAMSYPSRPSMRRFAASSVPLSAKSSKARSVTRMM